MNRSEGQWEQLAMYMTAPEIKNKYDVHWEEIEAADAKDDSDLWDTKLKESKMRFGQTNSGSKKPSRYETFKKEGVQNPVEIGYSKEYPKGYIGEGHHRVASMEKINPNALLPVTHDYEGPMKLRGTF